MDRSGHPFEKTYFASAELTEQPKVESLYHELKKDPLLRMFQEAMPDLAMILNANRQLVYANTNLIKFLDLENLSMPLGSRLGNLLNCIHSKEEPGGCGTTKACRFCGVVNAILQSMKTGKPVVKEARISALDGKEITSYDIKIKASPLIYKEQELTIVCIKDISDHKLRQIEKTHISDLLNTASELSSMVSSIQKDTLDEQNLKVLETVEKVNNELLSALQLQKILPEAEAGTLQLNYGELLSVSVLYELEEQFKDQEIAKDKKLFIDPLSHHIRFRTDKQILKHILAILLDNAFEASSPGMVVKAGVKLYDKALRFCVQSRPPLTEEARHQIFQRSFSTKGSGRGIGTYTARLLTTKYLKGKMHFNSNEDGTSFYLEVPLS